MKVTNEMKEISKYVLNKFEGSKEKGEISVIRHQDAKNESVIDILQVRKHPQEGEISYSTIGLSNYDIGLDVEKKPLRIEIVGCAPNYEKEYSNIMSTCAFNIINSHYSCSPGKVFHDVIKMYYPQYQMQHVMFVSPFVWKEEFETMEFPEKKIAWLQIIPISENECIFIEKNGRDAFEDLLEKSSVDILDLDRKSIL